MWLWGKGNLKKEDQQYGDWRRAEQVFRKSVVVVAGYS